MSGDNRAARASVQRTASVSRNNLQSGILFAEPPVALPNLDELRAADVLVRAYYDTLAKTPAPSSSATVGLPMDLLPAAAAAAPTESAEAAAPSVAVAERRAAAESIGAALARAVVESAAQLYTSRRLDDLVETYTACAAWDDARDVVAGSFLPQDLCGSGLHGGAAGAQVAGLPALSGGAPQATAAPLFLRSALSLAGVVTRTPTCTLTPQSSLTPPPLGSTSRSARGTRSRTPHNTWGPEPPACVPMDAYARYVTVVEEAPVPAAAAERPSSPQRAAAARPRVAKGKAKAADATSGAAAAAAAATTALSPSPPIVATPAGKRDGRGTSKTSLQLPRTPSQPLEASHARGKTIFGATAQPSTEDPLTRALRLSGASAVVDGAAGAARADRNAPRPAGAPLPAVVAGGADAERKAGPKPSPRVAGGGAAGGGGSAVVLAVEHDRLVTTERGAKALQRGGQRKDGVRCRVLAGEGSGGATPSPRGEEVADAERSTASPAEMNGEPVVQRGGKRSPQSAATKAAGAKGRKAAPAEREAWTASFFNATDAAGEASLQDQVQVSPSPGVTVVGGALPPSNAQSARRGHKAAAAASAVLHGGDFAVPADRLALSAFEEKRVAGRKANGGANATSPAKARSTPAFKSM